MARIIRPAISDPTRYRGLDWIFEYTNQDGALDHALIPRFQTRTPEGAYDFQINFAGNTHLVDDIEERAQPYRP